MFGKKKSNIIKVSHYEGIDAFATDYPCTLELKDGQLVITRLKPETIVTLPLERISSFTAMEEQNFMQLYHGNAATTSKATKLGIGKYYLVVKYDKGMLAFWGTESEYRKFIDLQYNGLPASTGHIEL